MNTLKNTSLSADTSCVDQEKLNLYEKNNNDYVDDTTTGDESSSTSATTTVSDDTVFTKSNTTATQVPLASSSSSSSSSSSTSRGSEPGEYIRRERLAVISYNDYVIRHEQLLETYSEIKDMMEQTKEFLFKHCDILLHEHAQSYMLLSCLEDEMNGKKTRMKLVCRQSQILSHIHELGNY